MEKISKISLIAFQGHLLEKQTVGIWLSILPLVGLICRINMKTLLNQHAYYSLGRPYPTPTSLTNPTRSTDILPTTKKSVYLVVNCNALRLDLQMQDLRQRL